MSSILEPANDYVLVADSLREQTIDGIVLPDNQRQQEMVFGTVVFIGPRVSESTKISDRICYGPFAGKTVLIDGIELRLLKEGQVEAYVRENR